MVHLINKWSGLLVLVLVLTFTNACQREAGNSEGTEVSKKVTTVVVNSKSLESAERVPGSVQPELSSHLSSKIPARIVKILVKEGDTVAKDQMLAELDGSEIKARLDQAQATETQALQDLKRFAKLLPAGAATQQEYDAAEARAKVASAAVSEAKAMFEYTKIIAPYAGVITKKLAEEGDLTSPGRPLLALEAQDRYRFEVDVPESLSSKISVGQEINVQISGQDQGMLGQVSEVSPTTDPNSRTQRIKIDLPKGSAVRSGQFGYVFVPTSGREDISIPQAALNEKGQLEYVFVVKDKTALLRLVRVGKRAGDQVEILSGLDNGDVIVLGAAEKLKDMDAVEVVQ